MSEKKRTVLIDGQEYPENAPITIAAKDLALRLGRLAAAEELLLLADRCHRQHPQAFFLTAAGEARAAGEKFIDELRAWKRGRKEG